MWRTSAQATLRPSSRSSKVSPMAWRRAGHCATVPRKPRATWICFAAWRGGAWPHFPSPLRGEPARRAGAGVWKSRMQCQDNESAHLIRNPHPARRARQLPRKGEGENTRNSRVKVRIGINPITWTNDDVPELGGDTPLETCLKETKQAGYAGTELGGKFPRDAKVLKPLMARYGLDVISGWYDGRCAEKDVMAEMEAIGPHLALLKAMGCRHVVYADTSLGRHGAIWGPISERPSLKPEDWRSYGRKLTELAERFADFGVRMAFHHHMGTIVETDEEVGL